MFLTPSKTSVSFIYESSRPWTVNSCFCSIVNFKERYPCIRWDLLKLEKDIHTTKLRESWMGKLGENALGPRIPVGQLWAGHSPGFIAAGLVVKNTLALFIWPTIKDHSSILHIHNHSMWPCAKTYRISRDHSRIILSNQNHPKFPFQNFCQFIVWLDSPIRLESSMFRFNKNSLAQGLRLADGALQFEPCSVWELLLPLQPVREEFGGICFSAHLKLFKNMYCNRKGICICIHALSLSI